MVKPKKDKVSKKALSYGNLYTQEAVTQFLTNFGKQPDTDEVLRKAGIARHRLKVLLDDDEVAQAVETRIDALLATPFRIEPSDTPEAELLRQELTEWFCEVAGGALNALLFGYSVQEVVYEQKSSGHIGVQWVGEKPMQWFEPKSDGRLIYRSDGNGMEKELDQKFKFLLTRRKATYEQPYGKALLATLYWLFFFKQNGFKFWAKFLERFGTPILLGKCADTETEDMSQALLNAHAQSVLSIDSEDDVQVLSTGNNGSGGASFDLFNTVLIRQIQKVVLGQTLTSGTDGVGSRALGQVHENVRQDKLKSDIRLVTPTLQTLVNALCVLNQWSEHKVLVGEKAKPLNKEQAERDSHLKNAGVRFAPEYFIREYGLQEGDVAELPNEPTPLKFSALPQRAFSFKADAQKITPEQQELEQTAHDQPKVLMTDEQLQKIVHDAIDHNDLMTKLYSATKGANVDEFEVVMSKALFMADVMGYVHAQQRK